MSALTALVLAGSRGPDDPMAVIAGVRHKALIPVGGVPMVLRVIRALAALPEIGRIVVCIEQPSLITTLPGLEEAASGKPIETLMAAGSPARSVVAALEQYATPMLVTTADHALLEPEWVRYFLAHQPAEADATVGLARSEVVLDATPDTQRTFLRFRGGAYSGCNLFYFSSPAAVRLAVLWQRIEALRKQPLKMLGLLGYRYALAYRFGWLTIGAALGRLGVISGGTSPAIVELPFGRAAIDVDKPADLALVERLVGQG